MNRTIIVRHNYLHYVKKYQRYEKRHSNIPAHISPCFRVNEGDHVIIGQCRIGPPYFDFSIVISHPSLLLYVIIFCASQAFIQNCEVQRFEGDSSQFWSWWEKKLLQECELECLDFFVYI